MLGCRARPWGRSRRDARAQTPGNRRARMRRGPACPCRVPCLRRACRSRLPGGSETIRRAWRCSGAASRSHTIRVTVRQRRNRAVEVGLRNRRARAGRIVRAGRRAGDLAEIQSRWFRFPEGRSACTMSAYRGYCPAGMAGRFMDERPGSICSGCRCHTRSMAGALIT